MTGVSSPRWMGYKLYYINIFIKIYSGASVAIYNGTLCFCDRVAGSSASSTQTAPSCEGSHGVSPAVFEIALFSCCFCCLLEREEKPIFPLKGQYLIMTTNGSHELQPRMAMAVIGWSANKNEQNRDEWCSGNEDKGKSLLVHFSASLKALLAWVCQSSHLSVCKYGKGERMGRKVQLTLKHAQMFSFCRFSKFEVFGVFGTPKNSAAYIPDKTFDSTKINI